MIVFAGFTPQTPLLLPTIGKQHHQDLAATLEGMKKIGDRLYAVHAETIVWISGSAPIYAEAFGMDVADPYCVDLKELGDLSSRETFACDLSLADAIQRSLRHAKINCSLQTSDHLDPGVSVPLLTKSSQCETSSCAVCQRPSGEISCRIWPCHKRSDRKSEYSCCSDCHWGSFALLTF